MRDKSRRSRRNAEEELRTLNVRPKIKEADNNANTRIKRDGTEAFEDNVSSSAVAPTDPSHLARKDYVDQRIKRDGSESFSANIATDAATPTLTTHLTRKSYVDAQVSTRILNAADTVSRSNVQNDFYDQGQGTSSMRKIGGSGGSTQAAASDHFHSLGFKTNLSQDERKDFLSHLHDVEAIRDTGLPSASEWQSVLWLVKRMARMQVDDINRTAEELIAALDNPDNREWAHEWRLSNEQDYGARWRYEFDEQYRAVMGDDPFVQGCLARCPIENVETDPDIVERSLERQASGERAAHDPPGPLPQPRPGPQSRPQSVEE